MFIMPVPHVHLESISVMPILNRAAEMQEEVAGWRRHLHSNPEIGFDVFATADFVAGKLRAFGCDEVVTGIGRTGLVGVIRGKLGDGRVVGLRADMDALPITEITGKPYASTHEGRMHACGHDGHTAMLLGAAAYLAETRNFAGTVVVIFQPAEESGGGGREMVRDGLMDRFGIEQVFGMHNLPGLPVGRFSIRQGPILAATAEFDIRVSGRGGHAAMPHRSNDPIVAASHLVAATQSIVGRNVDPLEAGVVSITKFHAGDAHNIIPEKVALAGTVRTLKGETATLVEQRLQAVCNGIAATFNHTQETDFAGTVAIGVAGESQVDLAMQPLMAGEDFSYMLEARPGAFIFIGNGDSAGLHHPAYDFNDEAIPYGVSYWVKLAEQALAG
jgi:hippurate hydrolase